jgi:hypothetical protein
LSILAKFFPSTSIFFKYFDAHPYVSHQGDEIKVPLTPDLKGIDIIELTGNKDFMVKVSDDETQLILTNVLDGGEF